ncbi:MAG: UDP-N-acetylmuramate dehydrogenase [Gammaproteobacteria bacterium]|nr:UDP-N-acetylmuramate dehydrogenase [Gammaproteobacteria bacterium]
MMAAAGTRPPASRTVRGELKYDEAMSKHTSWRVGGPADQFFVPADRADLIDYVTALPPELDVTWAGLGSNLLVRDRGVRGVVVCTHQGLDALKRLGDYGMYVEAGVPGAKIARFTVREGLSGAEFFAGIPGTLGGALAMNAGAFGGETWSVVRRVDTLDRRGRVHTRDRDEFTIGYREVGSPATEWFLSAELALVPGNVERGRAQIKSLLTKRAETQPIQIPNAGSVFRNPPGQYAAQLIEKCGLKGLIRGRAQVSERHANFIVNLGGARAQDIEDLIRIMQAEVEARFGVRLDPEVRIIGEPA